MKIIKNITIKGKHQKPIVTDVFYNETHQPKKIVIFCHGYKGFKDWGAWNLMAEQFANAGFFFIKFNFAYNGGTADNPIDFPDLEAFGNNNYTKELDDLETVISWISQNNQFKNEINIHEIATIGHSRAGGIVLINAAEDKRVKKVITLAGVSDFGLRTSTTGDLNNWKKTGVKYVLNGRTKQQMPHFYQFYENYIENKERLNIKKVVEKINIPHLIIHGNKDTSVKIEEAENLHNWNKESTFEIIENADHVFNTSHPWKKENITNELAEIVKKITTFLK